MKIFDIIRKQYVELTPEEEVRQYCIRILMEKYSYPKSSMAVEGCLRVNSMLRRFDILVYDKNLQPFMLVECKRKDVKLTQKTIDQIASYNYAIRAPYLMITNSLSTYVIAYKDNTHTFLNEIPPYNSII